MELERRPLLGYLPNGSTNDFAASLHLSSDPRHAAQAIASGGSRVAENGGRRRSVSRWDPKGLSGAELAAIRKRVQDGEKIRF